MARLLLADGSFSQYLQTYQRVLPAMVNQALVWRAALGGNFGHRLAAWTNGQSEGLNRTIKEATVKRFHYDDHNQLRRHLADFMAPYNFARRLETLNGLTSYEHICKIWTSEPGKD